MAYPTTIASLHFQYKTAFDVLKSVVSDKTDDQLAQLVLDFKSKKETPKDTPKEVKPKEVKPKEVKPKDAKPKKSKVEPDLSQVELELEP